MSRAVEPVSAKRHSRLTDARLVLARATRHRQLFPRMTPDRELIRDMRLALEGLLDELGATPPPTVKVSP